MTYSTVDISSENEIIYFHEFNTQFGYYRYNTSSNIRTLNGFTWLPLGIKHSEIRQTTDINSNLVTIDLPRSSSNTMESEFGSIVPKGSYTMFRGFLSGTGETIVNWKGRIISRKKTKTSVSITSESLFTSIKRSTLSDRFSILCRHSLYQSGCNLDKTYFAVSGTVFDISGKTITVSDAGYYEDGHFDGGMIELPDGELVMIISHSGEELVLDYVPDYFSENLSSSGILIEMFRGCDKTKATCEFVFNNLNNNGGFKYIPTRNPFKGTII